MLENELNLPEEDGGDDGNDVKTRVIGRARMRRKVECCFLTCLTLMTFKHAHFRSHSLTSALSYNRAIECNNYTDERIINRHIE